MGTCLHNNKLPLGDRLQLIRGHERPLRHLQSLRFILSHTDISRKRGAAAQGLGQHLSGLGVWRETAKNRVLDVILDDLRSLFSIVFLQLGKTLDDRNQCQLSGPARAEQRQDVEGGHGTQLVAEQHHPVRQLAAVLVRHGEQFTGQSLNHQASHEVFAGVLLRQDEEDGGFLGGEQLRVNGAVEAQHLLQL